MSHLILHVGHGKTGTSFIQSLLSLNVKELNKLNIHYPYHKSFDEAQSGFISSGNGVDLANDGRIDFEEFDNLLFSNEGLFHALLEDNILEKKILSHCDKLSVILYTRNVLEMLISGWGQVVKRGGQSLSLNEYLTSVADPHHTRVLKWIELSKEFNFDLYVRNYSRHKRDIFGSFSSTLCELIKVKTDSFSEFAMPEFRIVNRSMTLAEYALLQSANKIDKSFGRALSDAFVNKIPILQSEVPHINKNLKEELAHKYEPIITKINSHIDTSEAIAFESIYAENGDAPKELSKAHLDIFSDIFFRFYRSNAMLEKEINTIRDIASKVESDDKELGYRDALALMKIAHDKRPSGSFIKAKVEQWSELLKSLENE